jgi:serine/threonine-protein kinase RsbW
LTLEKKTEFKVESKLENLPKIAQFITETMENYGLNNLKDIYAVQLSVDEACTNIIQHAYSNNGGVIVVSCVLSSGGNQFMVNIVDWGKPFDPTGVPEPDIESSIKERKVGGLGIAFMKKFMDEVNYTRVKDTNLLVMVKYIQK